MIFRTLLIFMVSSIIFVLGAVIVWQRTILDAGVTRRLEDSQTIAELRDRIVRIEREAAAGMEEQQASASGQPRVDEAGALAEVRAERDAIAQRLESLSRKHADSLVERKRAADALVASERQLEDLRGAAARSEQDVSVLRAELLWQKVREPATATTTGSGPEPASGPERGPQATAEAAAARDPDAAAAS
ncbi:MAG: hypothetical protein ABL908_04135, partial [Hyphomicrobium sp.]